MYLGFGLIVRQNKQLVNTSWAEGKRDCYVNFSLLPKILYTNQLI